MEFDEPNGLLEGNCPCCGYPYDEYIGVDDLCMACEENMLAEDS